MATAEHPWNVLAKMLRPLVVDVGAVVGLVVEGAFNIGAKACRDVVVGPAASASRRSGTMPRTVTGLVEAERNDFADFLETLTPQQWAARSLCEGWTVRDVVAHVVSYEAVGAAEITRRVVQGRFMLNRINSVSLIQHRERDPAQLVATLREHVTPRGLTTAFGGRIALVDTLMHHQDIRRALGMSRDVPAERLRVALPFAFIAPPVKALWHVRGVKVVATDLDWAGGTGPEARGAGEAVLMVMGGRRGVAEELTGPGAPRLVQRLG